MGLLRDQSIPTIFQGISRQPDSIRFPGQVEDALNATFSVETGGFSKRLGTTVLTAVDATPVSNYKMHMVSRSSTEKYAMVHSGPDGGTAGDLRVFDLGDGSEKAVTIDDPADASFFDKAVDSFEFLTVLDYTFVVDKTETVAMLPAAAASGTTYAAMQLTKANQDSTYEVKVTFNNGDYFRAYLGGNTSWEPDMVVHYAPGGVATSWQRSIGGSVTTGSTNFGLGSALVAAKPDATWTVNYSGSFIYISNSSGVEFAVETKDPHGDTAWVVTGRRVTEPKDLVARSWNGHKVEIRKSTEPEGYWLKFVTDDPSAVYGPGTWDETVPDGTQTQFDPGTMPRALTRQPDGSFLLERLDWDEKMAGGDDLVPTPEFVGQQIADIVFRANRLGILSGETVYFSAAGDYFRFWPDSAVEITATDPFGLTNSTNKVSNFTYGVPFRRSLFIMSGEAQFEAYGDPFAPDTGRLEMATQYPANDKVRPVVLGDEMYFVSEIGQDAMLYSYVYNDDTVSEVAMEVSRHVRGFLKGPVVELASGALNNEIFILSNYDTSSVYTHKYYYEGRDRVQSAWSRFSFEGATIKSIAYQDGKLWLLIQRSDGVLYLESMPSVEADTVEFDVPPRLDRKVSVMGTYDSGTNTTTWDLGIVMDNPVVLTTNLFPENFRFLQLNVTQNGTEVSAKGDWTQSEVVAGDPYDSYVVFSRQFMREGDTAIINGRLQLRHMSLRYEDSGYFKVDVTPQYRDTRTYEMTGRILGAGDNQVQAFNLSSGSYRFLVSSNAETVNIRVGSDSFLPFTITSAAWVGFFNEISRQDRG